MKNIFNSVSMRRPTKSKFDLTHDVKMSMKMGRLTPCCIMDVVPGDKVKIANETLVRFAPLISPIMHRVDVSIHYFFVPNRIVWPNWDKWIFDPEYVGLHPFFTLDEAAYNGSLLWDYMGVPEIIGANSHQVNALPFAAYQMIYNEYYRDQNLQAEVPFLLSDGQNSEDDFKALRTRAWEHDYFTSALPFAQKGNNVAIPLGDVVLKQTPPYQNIPEFFSQTGTSATGDVTSDVATGGLLVGGVSSVMDPNGSLTVASTSITDLRRAFRLQEWLEKNARAGTRLTEGILAHFGVKNKDSRLDRPEYITGVKAPVTISEVLNTAGVVAADQLPQGNMAGHGISVAAGRYGSYFVPEHGYIIGIMSILPKTAYQQGLPRHLQRHKDQFLYYWPTFQHIGEQEILNSELYVNSATPDGTFGYVPRYAEYKYMPSRIAGEFKNTLSHWHMGRIFETEPALNSAFISSDPTTRIFAVQDGVDPIYVHCLNKITAVRPMSFYSDPYM